MPWIVSDGWLRLMITRRGTQPGVRVAGLGAGRQARGRVGGALTGIGRQGERVEAGHLVEGHVTRDDGADLAGHLLLRLGHRGEVEADLPLVIDVGEHVLPLAVLQGCLTRTRDR